MERRTEINARNAQVIAEFRQAAAQARAEGLPFDSPLLLLTTIGAKSGLPRTNPLRYLREGQRVFVFASFQGAEHHPDWYRNLMARGRATVELGTEIYEATPRLITGPERDGLYAQQVEQAPQFADYARRTKRVIPVVELVRV